MQPSKPAPRLTRRRNGVTVVEAAIVMVIVIAAVVIVLGGLSAKTSSVFARASAAFGGSVDTPAQVAKSETKNLAETPPPEDNVAFVLIRFGVFAAVVFAFMAYTTLFVSKAETGDPAEVERKAARKKEARTSLADLLLDRRSQIGRAIRDHTADFDSAKLTVEMFMTKKPITACVDDELANVMTIMRTRGFRHMMILDDQEKIAGIISDRDLVNTEGKKINEIMTPEPFTVEATTPISIAITLLVKNRISALPVLSDTEVVGVLTRSDLLVTLQCLMLNIQEHLSESRDFEDIRSQEKEAKSRDPREVIVTTS